MSLSTNMPSAQPRSMPAASRGTTRIAALDTTPLTGGNVNAQVTGPARPLPFTPTAHLAV